MNGSATTTPSPEASGIDVLPGDLASVYAAIDRARSLAIADLPAATMLSQRLMDVVPRDSAARSRVLALRGHVMCYANDFAGALTVLDESLALASGRADSSETSQTQLARVQVLARLGRLRDAEAAARASAQGFEATGQTALYAKAAGNLGIVLRMQGRLEEALASFAIASELLPDEASRSAIESNRAEALLDLDRYPEAMDAFARAQAGFAQAGHTHAAAIVEGNLADLHARLGHWEQAIERFESARLSFERAGSMGDAARLGAEHADTLRLAGAPRRAARMYREALPLLEQHGLAREATRAWLGLGLSLLSLDCAPAAVECLTRAVEQARTCGDSLLEGESLAAQAVAVSSSRGALRARELMNSALATMELRPVRKAMAL